MAETETISRTGLTEREQEIIDDADVLERLIAFRRLRSPLARHELKTAVCAHGLRSDEAERFIKRATRHPARRR